MDETALYPTCVNLMCDLFHSLLGHHQLKRAILKSISNLPVSSSSRVISLRKSGIDSLTFGHPHDAKIGGRKLFIQSFGQTDGMSFITERDPSIFGTRIRKQGMLRFVIHGFPLIINGPNTFGCYNDIAFIRVFIRSFQ